MSRYDADVFHFDLAMQDEDVIGFWPISTSTHLHPPPPPVRLAEWVEGLAYSQLLVVRQRANGGHWHWHITIRLKRTYKSTYKWWKKELDELDLKEPMLEAGPHDDWQYRIGYSQEDEIEILKQVNISDAYMLQAKNYYQLMKDRHVIRTFKRKLIKISREELPAVVEAAEVQFNTTRQHALEKLALSGFTFSGMEIHGAWAKRFREGRETGAYPTE